MILELLKNLMLDQLTNQKFRLIFSNTLSARENMAMDEALFASFDDNSLPIFRVYDWRNRLQWVFHKIFLKFQKK